MATDPSSLIQQLLSPQAINGFQQGQQQAQNNGLAQAQAQQQLQAGQMQMQQAQAQQAQEQQYSQDVAAWQKDGAKPEGLVSLATKYPQQAKALQDAWKFKADDERQSNQTFYAGVWNAAKNGNTDLVTKLLTDRKTALSNSNQIDQAASIDDALQHIQQDPAKGLTNIQSYALSQLFAASPPDYMKAFGIGGDKDAKAVTFGEGGVGHYEGNKLVVDEAPRNGPKDPRDNYIEVKNADGTTTQKYIGGGGDQASGGSPASIGDVGDVWNRMVKREGGSNPDGSFRTSSAGAIGPAQLMGNTITTAAQLAGVSPRMAATDPEANLAAGKAYFQKQLSDFGDPALAAAAYNAGPGRVRAAVANKGDNWLSALPKETQNYVAATVGTQGGGSRDISGAPSAGSGSSPIPDGIVGQEGLAWLQKNNPSLANRVQAVLDTRAGLPTATGSRNPINNQIAAAVNQIDPSFDQAAWKRRSETIQQYTPGGKVGQYLLSGKTVIDHAYNLALAAQKLPDHTFKFMNSASNAMGSSVNNKDLIDVREGINNYSTELPKFLGGKAPAQPEIAATLENHSTSLGASGLTRALTTDIEYVHGKLDPLIEAYKQNTGKDFDIDHQIPGGVITPKLAALDYYKTTGKLPIVVSSPAQAQALPHGSLFVTPDGRVKTR